MPRKLPAGSCAPPGPEPEPASMQVDPEQLGQSSKPSFWHVNIVVGGAG